jgi:hypothetical protein
VKIRTKTIYVFEQASSRYHPVQEAGLPACGRTTAVAPKSVARNRSTDDENQPRALSQRIDKLDLSFRIIPSTQIHQLLAAIATSRPTEASQAISLGWMHWSITFSRRSGCFTFENGDFTGDFDLHAQRNWRLRLEMKAACLASLTPTESVSYSHQAAESFGIILGPARVRRIDLCADIVNLRMRPTDRRGLVTKGGKVNVRYDKKAFTGIDIGSRPIRATIYDKTRELLHQTNADKRKIEHKKWRGRGWIRPAVSRIEFQFHGRALRQLGVFHSCDVVPRLDELWQYGCVEWLWLGIPSSSTRSTRFKLDPRWLAVQQIRFARNAQPPKRSRVSGGVSATLLLGYLISFLGNNAEEPSVRQVLTAADARQSPEPSACSYGTENDYRRTIRQLCSVAGQLCSKELVVDRDYEAAMMRLRSKIAAVFASRWSNRGPDNATDEPETSTPAAPHPSVISRIHDHNQSVAAALLASASGHPHASLSSSSTLELQETDEERYPNDVSEEGLSS